MVHDRDHYGSRVKGAEPIRASGFCRRARPVRTSGRRRVAARKGRRGAAARSQSTDRWRADGIFCSAVVDHRARHGLHRLGRDHRMAGVAAARKRCRVDPRTDRERPPRAGPIKPARDWLRRAWALFRQRSEDDADERYLAHHHAACPERPPVFRCASSVGIIPSDYSSGVNRCC